MYADMMGEIDGYDYSTDLAYSDGLNVGVGPFVGGEDTYIYLFIYSIYVFTLSISMTLYVYICLNTSIYINNLSVYVYICMDSM
jgi:hypothetical protein